MKSIEGLWYRHNHSSLQAHSQSKAWSFIVWYGKGMRKGIENKEERCEGEEKGMTTKRKEKQKKIKEQKKERKRKKCT